MLQILRGSECWLIPSSAANMKILSAAIWKYYHLKQVNWNIPRMLSAVCSWVCSHCFILEVSRRWGFVHSQSQECLCCSGFHQHLSHREEWSSDAALNAGSSRKWISLGKRRWIKRIYALRCMDFYFPPSYFLPLLSLGCVWSTLSAFLSPFVHRTGRHNHSHLNSARWKCVSASHDFTSKCLGSNSRLVL